MFDFIESITDASGAYRYLDGTQIVSDAREILNKVKVIYELETRIR